MATNFSTEGNGEIRTRKGHDMTWSCDIHGEPIKFHCKEHNIPLCHPCAFKDHQQPCQVDDIENIILEMGRLQEDKRKEIEDAKTLLEKVDTQINSCKAVTVNHLQSLNDEVNAAYEGKIKTLKDEEQEEICLINKEADEEIRIINEKRNKQIKAYREKAEQKLKNVKGTQQKLILECKEIDQLLSKKIEDLGNKIQHTIATLRIIDQKMKRIKQIDKELVSGAPQAIALLHETLSTNVAQDTVECLEKIKRDVASVKFVEGTVHGKQYSRIDGDIRKWELVTEIQIPPIVNDPCVLGLISDDEVCMSDNENNDLYVMNIGNGHTEKVIEEVGNVKITSCAAVDHNLIACGKRRKDWVASFIGYITLYGRKHGQWKVIRNITIPRDGSYNFESRQRTLFLPMLYVYVDVDKDGMILAGMFDRSDIYVINPAAGKIMTTVTMEDGLKVRGEIHSMPSGNILVNIGQGRSIVISRSGERIAEEEDGSPVFTHRHMTSSGNKVVREGDKISVFRKSYSCNPGGSTHFFFRRGCAAAALETGV